MSTILDSPPVLEQTDTGDHDRFSHWVTPKSEVTRAMVTGIPCKALCGKLWVPSADPGRFPVCPSCQEIVDRDFDGSPS